MMEIEERVEAMLAERARNVEVDDRLDAIISGVQVIPLASDRKRRGVVAVAVAAAALAILSAGAALVASSNDAPANVDLASSTGPDGDVYPILGSLGDLDSAVYGTGALPVLEESPVAVVHLGRRSGDTMLDIVSISVASDPDIFLGGDDLNGSESIDLGGRIVTRHTHPGYEWYQWTDGEWTIALSASRDAEALIGAIRIEPDGRGGVSSVGLARLPDGLVVLDEHYDPETGPLPGVSTDAGQTVSVDLSVDAALGFPPADDVRILTVNSVEGYVVEFDDAVYVTWPVGTGFWAQLNTRGLSLERTLEIADQATFTDRRTWEETYSTALDDYSTPPTTAPTVTIVGAGD